MPLARTNVIGGIAFDKCGESQVVPADSSRCTNCKGNDFAFHRDRYPQWPDVADQCIKCPHAPYGEATCDSGLLDFSDGFWHTGLEWHGVNRMHLHHATERSFTNETLAFFPCPCRECCHVHNVTGAVACKQGNAGALCAVCATGYYKRSDDGSCVACADASVKDDVPWGPLLAAAVFVALYLGSDARADWRRCRALQRRIQGCQRHLVGKSKVVLGFFQVLLLSKTVFRVPFPRVFVDFMNKFAFLRFELFKLIPLSCVAPYDFHDILDAVVCVSVVMVLPPWIKVASEYGLLRTARRWRGAKTAIKWLLVLTYLVYPTISSMLFQTFSCESIGLGNKRSAGAVPPARSRWLHQDYAIDCDSTEHRYYEALASFMIVSFSFGVPVLFWALLRPHRRNLNHADAQYLSFFFLDYNEDHWYWEIIECYRKLTLTGMALFFGEQGSLLQTAIAMGLMMIYIPVLIKMQPYKLPSDNGVAVLVNVGLFFVLFSSLLLKVKTSFASTGRFDEGYSEDALGYFLIMIALVIIAVWALSLLHDIRKFNARQSFRHKDGGGLLALPKLDSSVDEVYHVIISHSQQDGGDQVAHIKKELEKFVSTAVIFTDVASGRIERALTAKSALYSAIKQSSCFLVFLTKTYFTRKWCIKELQEAIARGKHAVIVCDTDLRHGGMPLKQMVAYAKEQRQRAKADEELGASNLHNQATIDGDAECEQLLDWVESHLSVSKDGGRLVIQGFEYEVDRRTHEVQQVPQRDIPVVPWYRYAEWKLIALQMSVQHVLAVPSWGVPAQKRKLALPVARTKLRPPPSGCFHVALSGRHVASARLEQKLLALSPHIRVCRPADHKGGQALAPEVLESCSCFLLVNNPDSAASKMSQLVSDPGYQADVRAAIDLGLPLVLLHECTTEIAATQGELWAMVEQGSAAFEARHVSAIFNPIAIYCQPTLLRAASARNTLFDHSTLVQLERAIAAAQHHSVWRWVAEARRRLQGCTRVCGSGISVVTTASSSSSSSSSSSDQGKKNKGKRRDKSSSSSTWGAVNPLHDGRTLGAEATGYDDEQVGGSVVGVATPARDEWRASTVQTCKGETDQTSSGEFML